MWAREEQASNQSHSIAQLLPWFLPWLPSMDCALGHKPNKCFLPHIALGHGLYHSNTKETKIQINRMCPYWSTVRPRLNTAKVCWTQSKVLRSYEAGTLDEEWREGPGEHLRKKEKPRFSCSWWKTVTHWIEIPDMRKSLKAVREDRQPTSTQS